MSLFEYAQEIVSRKLERKEPMLTISMGMQPVMPMAQGGGLSTVQNSLNINGEPHRLAYINPSEESLLQQLGGSGRKIDGIPAYYDAGNDSDPDSGDTTGGFGGPNDGIDDSVDGGSNQGAPDDPGGFGTMGLGGYSASQSAAVTQGLDAALAQADAEADTNLDPTLDIKEPAPYSYVPEPNVIQSLLNITPKEETVDLTKGTVTTATSFGIPGTLGLIGRAVGINPQIGPIDIEQSLYGPTEEDDQGFDQADTAGDEVIREKIAAVKNVPVEEVTVEEVKRAKRLTAAQRVAGTRLEDILDDIYGSGKGAGLLGIATNNTGTA